MASTYVQTSGNHQTNAPSYTPIPGLALTLPPGVQTEAIVILNVPNPYANGNNYPGGNFGIAVDGKVLPMVAIFTYDSPQPQSSGRRPTTLVVGVPLAQKAQKIEAMWSGIRGATVFIDTPASLCYMLD
jgi:mannose-binding lectin